MEYDILTKKGKTARIYTNKQLELAKLHAKETNGKVICRKTGEVIANFCKEKLKKDFKK